MFSDLISGTILSPNFNEVRQDKVCKITPHHAAWVNASARDIANSFVSPDRGASANYCIGVDGEIIGCVSELSRAWTSSSAWNDNQAITIEVANDGNGDTDWHISDASWNALVDLCVDICRRYDFVLDFTGDKDGSLTAHRFFAATACPGDYLFSRLQELADEVNRRLELNGWIKQDETWYYYENGQPVTDSWVLDSGKWYYLDSDGEMKSNCWIKWNDKWCYVEDDGSAFTNGWKSINDKWYCFDSDGYMLENQWVKNDSGTWSYVGENGAATTGWRELEWNGKIDWYLFDSNGNMCVNTWNNDYFVGNSGAMLTDTWVGHAGEYYWVDSNGHWDESKPNWYSNYKPDDGFPIYEY